jgi:cellulose synthase/poly-beta-1,6-N-acetylglucosamine synthase-like glycosyltransferase
LIHDNGSDEPGMADYLMGAKERDGRILDVTLSERNRGLSAPVNEFWSRYRDAYPYLGKIDNDTMIPEDGVERLVDIMDHCSSVGICHGFHWFAEDFPRKRLRSIDGRLLLTARWGGGCFYAIRSSVVQRFKAIPSDKGMMAGWTHYQIRVRRRGHRVVYAFPLVRVKHLGDFKSGRPEERLDYKSYNARILKLRRARSADKD